MTTPSGQPVNIASGSSYVGLQAGHADIDTVIIPGNVQLSVGQDASPEIKYRVGVENLNSGNPRTARKYIWDAMMSGPADSQMLFHWLVAMLSDRTVVQFSAEEKNQLRQSRSRYAELGDDGWADGVRLIYRLLDSVLAPVAGQAGHRPTETDMSLLIKQFESLGAEQRDMVLPHIELFLTGPRQDEMWQRELEAAQSRQYSGGRLARAWMFFQPVPAKVRLPLPSRERISGANRLAMHAGAWLFAAAAGYSLWHGAFIGLPGYVAVVAGAAVVAAADLERRFMTWQYRQKDALLRVASQASTSPSGDGLAAEVDKLFRYYFDKSPRDRYFSKFPLDTVDLERWKADVAGIRRFYRDEIIGICRDEGISAKEVAWLIRYEVRQLRKHWQDGSMYEYRRELVPRPGTAAARWTGLPVLVLGALWAAIALRAHLLADVLALTIAMGAIGMWWRYWLRVNLECMKDSSDRDEYARRQEAIDQEFALWNKRLEARPKDAEMATWLSCDRTVLQGQALDHFQLPRSHVDAHAFLEESGVAPRRARIGDAPFRYTKYRLLVFLLAKDGVRQVKASLDFLKGTLNVYERTSYRYDAIVSMQFSRKDRRQTFELRLTSGDPITFRVWDANPGADQQDHDSRAPGEPSEIAEDFAPDMTSVADLLHVLEGVAGEGRNWPRENRRGMPRPDGD